MLALLGKQRMIRERGRSGSCRMLGARSREEKCWLGKHSCGRIPRGASATSALCPREPRGRHLSGEPGGGGRPPASRLLYNRWGSVIYSWSPAPASIWVALSMKGLEERLNATKTPMSSASAEPRLLTRVPHLPRPRRCSCFFLLHPETRARAARGLVVLVLTAAPHGRCNKCLLFLPGHKTSQLCFKMF